MCTSPNYMVWSGKYTANDRPKLNFVSGTETNYDWILKSGLLFIQVPCQKCLECRIQQKSVWADRCTLEAKKSPYNYFVTLTYDDRHLPQNKSLRPRDLQLFMKRLRKRVGSGVKFFGCGEYGDSSLRPHYHLILFNCKLDDLTYMFYQEIDGDLVQHLRPENNGDLKFSQTIFDSWISEDDHSHLGQISVGQFSWLSAAYVAGYCLKKVNPKQAEFFKETNRIAEFMRCSKGIGSRGFDDEIYDYDNIVVSGHVRSVPRYFDKLFIKKYGDTVFDKTVRSNRLSKRFIRESSYLHDTKIQALDNKKREYRIKKKQKIRSAI